VLATIPATVMLVVVAYHAKRLLIQQNFGSWRRLTDL